MTEHWFWLLLTIAAVVWYSSVTIYVAIRGAIDIKHMLRNLADRHLRNSEAAGKAE
jgi:hypothetical protein